MPAIRQYIDGQPVQPTDAFPADRLGVGTIYETAQDLLAYIQANIVFPIGGQFPQTFTLPASETISVADGPAMLNIWTQTGAAYVRNGNATDNTKPVDCYTLNNYASGQIVTCYTRGIVLAGFTGLTPGGSVYLANTAGLLTQTTGDPSQRLGVAISATTIVYDPQPIYGGAT